MPYRNAVTSRIALATTSVTSANLGATVFTTTHQYFTERLRPYTTMEEVRNDPEIPSTSVAYQGLLRFFSQPNAAVPVYLGRRTADSLTLTPTPIVNNSKYGLTMTVHEDSSNTSVTTVVSVVSSAVATDAEIATALAEEINTTLPVANVSASDNTGSLSIVADAGYTLTFSSVDKLEDTYTTSETAAELLAGIQEEDNENWYFFSCDDTSETFVLAMATEIEASENSDYPKEYHFSTSDANSLVALPDPAIDLLGKVKEGNYSRTAGYWYHEPTYFQELVSLGQMGGIAPGTSTWKFRQDVPARDPVTGKKLSTAKQGYLRDRNASWYGEERGVAFSHGGTMANGEWIDVIRSKDFLNNEIEVALLNLLLNQPNGKIAFTPQGKAQVAHTVDGVLKAAVDSGILSGYIPTTIPSSTPFVDQAARILDEVKWVGYLAGAVHFIIVDGVLTYQDAELT